MDAKTDIFVKMLKLMAAYISGFTVCDRAHGNVVYVGKTFFEIFKNFATAALFARSWKIS